MERRFLMSESQDRETTRMSQQTSFKHFGGSAPENYERFFVPVIAAPLATELVDVAKLSQGERVLDVACGTGVVARLAAERVGDTGTVAGIDLNPGMLEVARSVTPSSMVIDWHQSSAEAMPLPNEAFDVVLCQMGLQFVPDKPAALREMQRVLVPGGRLIINVVGPKPRVFAILAEALAHHIKPETSGFVDVVFSLHEPGELQHLISGAGLREVDIRADTRTLRLPAPEEFLWQYVHSTPLAKAVAQVDEATRAALERDVVAKWQEFAEDGALPLQVGVVVATARK
jgi:ubiquinone/menaquinone biosynthesis C-methylase UbiE